MRTPQHFDDMKGLQGIHTNNESSFKSDDSETCDEVFQGALPESDRHVSSWNLLNISGLRSQKSLTNQKNNGADFGSQLPFSPVNGVSRPTATSCPLRKPPGRTTGGVYFTSRNFLTQTTIPFKNTLTNQKSDGADFGSQPPFSPVNGASWPTAASCSLRTSAKSATGKVRLVGIANWITPPPPSCPYTPRCPLATVLRNTTVPWGTNKRTCHSTAYDRNVS